MTTHRYLLPSAERQADAMLAVLALRRPGAAEQLRVNALDTLAEWRSEIRIRLVDESDEVDQGCSVHGAYRHDTGPPSIIVAATSSVRRRQFTALHELGHHLQRTDLDLGERLMETREPSLLEDLSCDAFAARVLLPDDLTNRCLGTGTPTSAAVSTLYRESGASRAASCVRAATRITGSGAVVLYDQAGRVSFAAGHGDVLPPRRGSDQSTTDLVMAALEQRSRGSNYPIERSTAILYREGYTRSPLYGQATWCDGFLMAVLVEHDAPWRGRVSPPRSSLDRPGEDGLHECSTCGEEAVVLDRCQRCREPRCVGGHCGCTQNAERLCPSCFLHRHPRLFVPQSEKCLECRE